MAFAHFCIATHAFKNLRMRSYSGLHNASASASYEECINSNNYYLLIIITIIYLNYWEIELLHCSYKADLLPRRGSVPVEFITNNDGKEWQVMRHARPVVI